MIETVALAGTVVGYLAKKIKENKDVKQFFSDFTSGTVNWIRPVFLTDDDTPKEALKDLISDPEEKLFQESLKVEIAKHIKKNPENESLLKSLVDEISKMEGDLKSGYTVNQKHFGTGDNVGRDKITK